MSTGSVSETVTDAVNSLVDRGRRSTEKINEKINEKLSEKISANVAEILSQEVDRRLGPLQAQIDELAVRLAALESSGSPVTKKAAVKKVPGKKAAAKKRPSNGAKDPRATGASGST
jgi:F0F1-type ATP synthase membrane subunit b/b'